MRNHNKQHKQNKQNLSYIASCLTNDKWLLDANTHANLVKRVDKAMTNGLFTTNEIPEFIFENDNVANKETSLTAIISINGVLMKGVSECEEECLGLVNIDFVSYAIDDALADPSVSTIVLNIASPGGSTVGTEELGRKIAEADKIKPIYAWTEQNCCSAAYWLASQCRKIGMTPSACIGGVGVFAIIEDYSKALESQGINVQAISSGKFKLMGHDFRKLTEEERTYLQTDITKQHDKFKAVIKAKRNIDDANMEGLSYEGEDAAKYNFTDVVVDSLNEFLANLTTTETIDTSNTMKSYTKQASAQPVVKAVETPTITKQAESPTDKPEETPAKHDEPDKEEGCKHVECPHCKKTFEYTAEEVKMEEETPAEPKKEETKTEEPEKPVETKKEETTTDTKKEEDTKTIKKMTLPTDLDWKQALGYAPKQKNAFYEASVEMVKNFSQLK